MPRAAIYARRSTDEHQADSIEIQLDYARRFAASKGFDVVLEVADSASGAEWMRRKRPGIYEVRDAAIRGELDVVVVREGSRVGRDMHRAPLWLADLSDHGVRVLCYATSDELRMVESTDRLVTTIKAYSDEEERRKIASRTRDALERKARSGLVAGGTIYGYRNVRAQGGVRREVYEPEAAIVREANTRYTAGEGRRAIVKDLNARGIAAPRGGTWCVATLDAILRRELYAGRTTWGTVAKDYRGGTKVRRRDHAHELVRVDLPELRILDEAAWQAAQDRRRSRGGAPARVGRPALYLLSGLLRCHLCGGPVRAGAGHRSRERVQVYLCAGHRDRGTCPSTLRRDVEAVDGAVLMWLRDAALGELLDEILAEVRRQVEERAAGHRASVAGIETQVRGLRVAVGQLVDAAAEAPSEVRPAIYARLAERQRELALAEDRLRVAVVVPAALEADLASAEASVRARLALLGTGSSVAALRPVLEQLFAGGIVMRPLHTEHGVRVTLEAQVDPLSGVRVSDRILASPAGRYTFPLRATA